MTAPFRETKTIIKTVKQLNNCVLHTNSHTQKPNVTKSNRKNISSALVQYCAIIVDVVI